MTIDRAFFKLDTFAVGMLCSMGSEENMVRDISR
jgi:hypothetical protein